MLEFITNIFRGDPLAEFRTTVEAISARESEIEKLTDEELRAASRALKTRVAETGVEDEGVIVEAFALARESARRTLKQRPFNEQLLGGLVLHKGGVAEMMTGEGKTLAAVAPTYLNALAGKGAHVVTVNEYLARRDAVWMGQIYRMLGLSVACLVPNGAFLYDPEWHIQAEGEAIIDAERDATGNFLVQQEYLRPTSRREAYLADITYGTNHEFGFDYLRDNLASDLGSQVQREPHFAIIDEVDSILIDEARTPLIIAAPDAESSEHYKTFARVVSGLQKDTDYDLDEKRRTVSITEAGIEKVEKLIGVQNIYAPENLRLVHYLEESLRAKALFMRDKDYVVKNGEILIVDEFTGRLLQGRRYNGGLHQAIEAKEGVLVKEESRTYAKISIQNYFRMYKKISGMTGTAQTSAEEFFKVYKLDVFSIPPHRPLVRKDETDKIYANQAAKWRAVVRDIKEHYENGQPVLVGTTSIEKNELLSAMLNKAGVMHEMLNAKNNEREGAIIAQAGRLKAVTVATNMAGRGVDIILGGNPPKQEEAEKVRTLGGLHVVGTERHEARRIDNQLRGRAGRQGDPGSSQFYLALDDDLVRIFGGDRIQSLMQRFDMPEDEPMQMNVVANAVAQAQSKVEGANFDMRKHLLEYDDVLNKQRSAVYRRRQELLMAMNAETLAGIIETAVLDQLKLMLPDQASGLGGMTAEELKKAFLETGIVSRDYVWRSKSEEASGELEDELREILKTRSAETAKQPFALGQLLGILDMLWMTHLENLEALSESVGLRAYGQHDPLVEYRAEAHRLYKDFWVNWNAWVFANLFKFTTGSTSSPQAAQPIRMSIAPAPVGKDGKHVGRNDPCPCGSGKKYKRCHGK